MKKYSKTELEQILENFLADNGRPPKMKEMNSKSELPSYLTYKRILGMSPSQFLMQRHPELKSNNEISKKGRSGKRSKTPDEIVTEYDEFIKSNGRMPSSDECKTYHIAYPATFKKIVGCTPCAYFGRSPKKPKGKSHSSEITSHAPAISQIMKRLGITIADLEAQTGIPAEQLGPLLINNAPETYQQLFRIARVLGVPMELLYR